MVVVGRVVHPIGVDVVRVERAVGPGGVPGVVPGSIPMIGMVKRVKRMLRRVGVMRHGWRTRKRTRKKRRVMKKNSEGC
jgi:coenzyme F420-reducing hydrogenase beta subunit